MKKKEKMKSLTLMSLLVHIKQRVIAVTPVMRSRPMTLTPALMSHQLPRKAARRKLLHQRQCRSSRRKKIQATTMMSTAMMNLAVKMMIQMNQSRT